MQPHQLAVKKPEPLPSGRSTDLKYQVHELNRVHKG
jgi:hypothetical protein